MPPSKTSDFRERTAEHKGPELPSPLSCANDFRPHSTLIEIDDDQTDLPANHGSQIHSRYDHTRNILWVALRKAER